MVSVYLPLTIYSSTLLTVRIIHTSLKLKPQEVGTESTYPRMDSPVCLELKLSLPPVRFSLLVVGSTSAHLKSCSHGQDQSAIWWMLVTQSYFLHWEAGICLHWDKYTGVEHEVFLHPASLSTTSKKVKGYTSHHLSNPHNTAPP